MPDPVETILSAHDHATWRRVPDVVAGCVRRLALPAFKQAAAADDDVRLYWNPVADRYARNRPPSADYFLIKQAAEDFLRPVAEGFRSMQKPLGGPHPLAASIVGGVLGSGLGYGGGYLAEKLLGDRVEKGKLRRTGLIAGGLLGAAPGVIAGVRNMASPRQTGGGLAAWTSRWPDEPGLDEPYPGSSVLDHPSPVPAPPPGVPAVPWAGKSGRFDGRLFHDPDVKLAAVPDAGAFYMPTIPVDAFNNVVWNDVHSANPYGTRSAWGTNEQPLRTPPAAAAAVSGLVAGAGAATSTGYVSPYHLALTAGVAGGKGYVAGLLAGKVLGVLAGLPAPAQETLQRVGLWSGLISGVANAVFG